MARASTFLELAPEFGGTLFGPFPGPEIRLGSSPDRTDIRLPETLGVAAVHCRVVRQDDTTWLIAPVDRAAAVWFHRSSGGRPSQLDAPVAARAGDAFSLVTPEGPRFTLRIETGKSADDASGKSHGQPPPSSNFVARFGREIFRIGLARMITARIGASGMWLYNFVRNGTFLSPVFLVGFLTMGSGWFLAGGSSCAALGLNKTRLTAQTQLRDCRDQLGVEDGEASAPTVPGLVRTLLNDREWQATLLDDREFTAAFARELKLIFASSDRYRWAYTRDGSVVVRTRAGLQARGLPEDLVRALGWAAALPGQVEREWKVVVDSEGEEVCGRGPLALTWRQAVALGLDTQPDALVERAVAASGDTQLWKDAIGKTTASISAPAASGSVLAAGAELQGGLECLVVEGADDRLDPTRLANALAERIGSDARGLPTEQGRYWIAARLVYLGALDFRRGLEELRLDGQPPSVALEAAGIPKARAEFAVGFGAAIAARAVAIPCLAVLDREVSAAPPDFLGELPNLGNCAIIKAFVEYDRL